MAAGLFAIIVLPLDNMQVTGLDVDAILSPLVHPVMVVNTGIARLERGVIMALDLVTHALQAIIVTRARK